MISRGIHTIFIGLFGALTLSIITKINLFSSLIGIISALILVLLSETVTFLFAMSVLKLNPEAMLLNFNMRLAINIVIKIIEFLTGIVLLKNNAKFLKFNLSRKEDTMSSLVILQLFMVAVILTSVFIITTIKVDIKNYLIYLILIYILCIWLTYLDFKERIKILTATNKIKAQEEYIKNIETTMDVIRKEKHDFHNHINVIYAMSLMNKDGMSQDLQSYLRNLSNDLVLTSKSFHTGNNYVDALLAVKNTIASKNGIAFDVEFEAPLDYLDINKIDITTIIGNIVDNAIHAVFSNVNLETRVVSISTYIENEFFYLSIANTGDIIPEKSINKIFESGFSTKKNNSGDHGFGLFIVKQLVSKSKGEITVKSDEFETQFLIRFKLSKDMSLKYRQQCENTEEYAT